MKHCPFCGNKLKKELTDGISSCINCIRTFDNSIPNKMLSAFWLGIKTGQIANFLSEKDALFVFHKVEECYSYDEFSKLIK